MNYYYFLNNELGNAIHIHTRAPLYRYRYQRCMYSTHFALLRTTHHPLFTVLHLIFFKFSSFTQFIRIYVWMCKQYFFQFHSLKTFTNKLFQDKVITYNHITCGWSIQNISMFSYILDKCIYNNKASNFMKLVIWFCFKTRKYRA